MNDSPNPPSTRPKRSLIVPMVVALVLAAIVAGWAFYSTRPHAHAPTVADTKRWHAYQDEHSHQSDAAQQAFAQHQAQLEKKKGTSAPAAKSPAVLNSAP